MTISFAVRIPNEESYFTEIAIGWTHLAEFRISHSIKMSSLIDILPEDAEIITFEYYGKKPTTHWIKTLKVLKEELYKCNNLIPIAYK